MVPLVRTQKNQIFKALQDGGLSEEAVERLRLLDSDDISSWPKEAKHKDSNRLLDGYIIVYPDGSTTYFFAFFGNGDYWRYKAFPLGTANNLSYNMSRGINWPELIKQIKKWAAQIKGEIFADDFWDRFVDIRAHLNICDEEDIDNAPFTSREATDVRAKLALLQEEILSRYVKDQWQREFVQRKFDYLEECIERQGKTDWVHTMVGVLASIAIGIGISAANNDQFWQLVKATIGATTRLLGSE